jgi:hypothetical protein
MCVCMYVCIYVCMYECMYVYTCIYVCMYVRACVRLYVRQYVCLYECLCATYVPVHLVLTVVFTTTVSYYIEATHAGPRLITLTFLQRILRPWKPQEHFQTRSCAGSDVATWLTFVGFVPPPTRLWDSRKLVRFGTRIRIFFLQKTDKHTVCVRYCSIDVAQCSVEYKEKTR